MNGTKCRAALAALTISTLWSTTAMAGDDESEAAHAEDPAWLFGVGVALPALAVAGGGVGGLAGPLYGTSVERRLTDSLWLTGALSGSFQSQQSAGSYVANSTAYAVDAQLGLRHVINPADRFQLSIPTSLGASYGFSEADQSYATRSWSVHVDAGLALELWVAEAVALRVANTLLSIGHARSLDGASSTSSWFAQVGLSPSFAVELGL